jgi:hypothetical protein
MNDIKGGWRKHSKEATHNLYSSPNIAGIDKSRRIRLATRVALMGEKGNENKI